jgi:hypothetical protein
MNTGHIPTPGEQILFLQQLRRILSDGSFVATYKFALLHALADLAVTKGGDSGAPLALRTREIAEQMVELYWRQTRPFPSPRAGPHVLHQNTGRRAKILGEIEKVQERHGYSLAAIRRRPEVWSALTNAVDRVVRGMPLWRLQTVGNERLDFLYENLGRGNVIMLRPGVAFCMRVFYDLIVDLLRGHWLRYVRRQNAQELGDASDLSAFLFGSERTNLSLFQPLLSEIQTGDCFYCQKSLGGRADVDHFIPWAKYPIDLGHNFVLAHGTCNRSKSDHLAAEKHLERWLRRNADHRLALAGYFDEYGVGHDLESSTKITRWAYAQTDRLGGQVWSAGRTFKQLTPEWERVFEEEPPFLQ